MAFWDARLGFQHHHTAFANARTQARLCPKQRSSSCMNVLFHNKEYLSNNHPMLSSQKTFKDLFNF